MPPKIMQDSLGLDYMRMIMQDLVGKTFDVVERRNFKGNEGVIFKSKDHTYMLVFISSDTYGWRNIVLQDDFGNLSDLENSEIIKAELIEEVLNRFNDDDNWHSYEIATSKGSVSLNFCINDGDYSMFVSLIEIMDDGEYREIFYQYEEEDEDD